MPVVDLVRSQYSKDPIGFFFVVVFVINGTIAFTVKWLANRYCCRFEATPLNVNLEL